MVVQQYDDGKITISGEKAQGSGKPAFQWGRTCLMDHMLFLRDDNYNDDDDGDDDNNDDNDDDNNDDDES